MRIALIVIIGIHSIIHLFGFLKAFGISEFNTISQPISKVLGIFWLMTFMLFAITFVLLLFHFDYWWICGILALIASQLLIFNFWTDAKFGTLANIIILLAIIAAYFNYSFSNKIKEERTELIRNAIIADQEIVSADDILNLPTAVQKWLNNSGIIWKPKVSNVHLVQELQLKLKPEQSEWNNGTAEQYFTVNPPAFNWNIDTEINSILSVVGRDKFEKGKGEMIIKLFSLIPVADAKNNAKIDQASLQRYLAEIVWFPSAALSPYIKWESSDDYSAKATMEFEGTKGSGVFYFDEHGYFKKFVALRFKDVNDSHPIEWTVTATKTEEVNGIKIPIECKASWKLEDKNWTWLKLKIKQIKYNIGNLPAANINTGNERESAE